MAVKAQDFSWPVRIYYEDTDAGGIVYHANYLKYMERARTEWLRQLGYEQDELAERAKVLFVVKKITIDYQRPARFNDEIVVVSRVLRCGRASINFDQRVMLAGICLVGAQIKVGCVDTQNMAAHAMPPAVYAELSNVAN